MSGRGEGIVDSEGGLRMRAKVQARARARARQEIGMGRYGKGRRKKERTDGLLVLQSEVPSLEFLEVRAVSAQVRRANLAARKNFHSARLYKDEYDGKTEKEETREQGRERE